MESLSIQIDINVEHQEMTSWCWASIAQAMLLYYNSQEISQKELVSIILRGDAVKFPERYSVAYSIKGALMKLGFDVVSTKGVIDKQSLITLLQNNNPVILRIIIEGGGGHYLLIRGLEYRNDQLLLQMADPKLAITELDYDLDLVNQPILLCTHTYVVKSSVLKKK